MRRARPIAAVCLALAPVLAPAAATDVDSIVEAERAFLKLTREKGTKQASLAVLADDGVIFRPGPVMGKSWWSQSPDPPGLLSWEPVFADVSRGGDLGYTTGPWEFREKSATDAPAAFGQYVTIWSRQPGGAWRIALDTGISHAKPKEARPAGVATPPREAGAPPDPAPPAAADAARDRTALLDLDRGLSVESFGWVADEAIRLYRSEMPPVSGRSGARGTVKSLGGLPATEPIDAVIARSGDLAYTFGTAEQKKPPGADPASETVGYLRIWKRRDRKSAWRLVLDATTPLPPSARPGAPPPSPPG